MKFLVVQRRAVGVLPIASAWVIGIGACDGGGATEPVGPSEPDPLPVVDSIRIVPSERPVGVLGAQFMVRGEGLAASGERLSYGPFSWSSSDPGVATVGPYPDPNYDFLRVVTGVSEGTVTITATGEGVVGSMTVSVQDRARSAWSTPVGTGSIQSGVAIGADGTIYVGTDEYAASARTHWYALSPEGSVLWTLSLPRTRGSTPAIGDDGTLYIGSDAGASSTGILIAVAPGGTVRWMLDGISRIRSSPAIGADGTIYVAGRQHLYAVDPQGGILWTYEHDGPVFFVSSPAIASDGTIYVGGEDGRLYAFDPDGSLRWAFTTRDRIRSSPTIDVDGTIYFGSHDGRLYAVRPDGTEQWSLELHCGLPWGCMPVTSSPSIGPDGEIYVEAGSVFAVDPGGSIRWNFASGSREPIVGADGTVYVVHLAFGQHGISALDTEGTLLWDQLIGIHVWGSPAIGIDGAIIAASHSASYEATVHAIRENAPSNGGFTGSPWPKERGNRSNSGRVGG